MENRKFSSCKGEKDWGGCKILGIYFLGWGGGGGGEDWRQWATVEKMLREYRGSKD